MLFFITMKRMSVNQTGHEADRNGQPDKPKSTVFFPTHDKLHFAVGVSAFPSSKQFQYKVYIKHVDQNGIRHQNTPLYGLKSNDTEILSTSTVEKIAKWLHMFIALTDNRMWFEFESFSPPNKNIFEVCIWASIFRGYTKYEVIEVDVVEKNFMASYKYECTPFDGSYMPPLKFEPSFMAPQAKAVHPLFSAVSAQPLSNEIAPICQNSAITTPCDGNLTDQKKRKLMQSTESTLLTGEPSLEKRLEVGADETVTGLPNESSQSLIDENASVNGGGESGDTSSRISWDDPPPDDIFEGLYSKLYTED